MEASLTAPPPVASGGHKSRRHEPQCHYGRKGEVRPSLTRVNIGCFQCESASVQRRAH